MPATSNSTGKPLRAQQPMGREQRADALVVEQAADERDRCRAFRLRRGAEALEINAGAGNELDALRRNADLRNQRAVIGVLHQRNVARMIDQEPQHQADRCRRMRAFIDVAMKA